jgi:putative transposase
MLAYKAVWFGGKLVAVPPAYTSQRCCVCGHVDRGNRLSQARFVCRACGHEDNADVNAARNILDLGIGIQTGGRPGLACESNRTSGRKQENRVVRHGSPALKGRV